MRASCSFCAKSLSIIVRANAWSISSTEWSERTSLVQRWSICEEIFHYMSQPWPMTSDEHPSIHRKTSTHLAGKLSSAARRKLMSHWISQQNQPVSEIKLLCFNFWQTRCATCCPFIPQHWKPYRTSPDGSSERRRQLLGRLRNDLDTEYSLHPCILLRGTTPWRQEVPPTSPTRKFALMTCCIKIDPNFADLKRQNGIQYF